MITRLLAGITISILATGATVMAQERGEDEPEDPKVEMIGAVKDGQIVLRWAPNTPVAWQLANKYGYTVERFTVMRDSAILAGPEKVTLTAGIHKPRPLAGWEDFVDEDDFAAIAAQAIYGETFELTDNYSSDISQVYLKSKELETRFSFALFAADHSFKVAEASGLALTDPSVKENEKYLYRVFTHVPAGKEAIDTGFVYIGLDDYMPLPKPVGVEAVFGDKAAMISWNWAKVEDFYNSFIVERSDDGGKTFHPVTDRPIINSEEEGKGTPEEASYLDSLGQNNKEVFYRVKGITPFGDISPASDTVSGIPRPLLKYAPTVSSTSVDEEGVLIKWNFAPEANHLIEGFRLYRAGKFKGDYELVHDNIMPEAREIRHTSPPSSSNYYSISAFDRYGNENMSLPVFAAVEDSIPPLAPVGLVGTVDSTGIVSLNWQPNTEQDLEGYRVYKANFMDEEFGEITIGAVKDSTFTDTISIQTLTKSVYYKITAVDRHFNPSGFSEVLELKRPDINPPAPPVFKASRSQPEGIYIEWISSPSRDVVQHVMYRRSGEDNLWEPVAIIEEFETYNTYVDSLAHPGEFYEYTLLAVDDSELESPPAKPVGLRMHDNAMRPRIETVFAKADRESKKIRLAWEYNHQGVEKYLIYKAEESGRPSLYKSLPAGQTQFEDDRLKVNTIYKYRIQAQYTNGALSPFSKEMIVNY